MPVSKSTAYRTRKAVNGLALGAVLTLVAVPAMAQTQATTQATTQAGTQAPGSTNAVVPGPAVTTPSGTATPAVAPPAPAQPTPVSALPPPQAVPSAGPTSAADLQGALGKDKSARIESHIARLHSDLKITPAQEPLWANFAGTMRTNAVQLEGAYGRRQQNYAGMNAVQDLQSYGEVEQINARNIAQLLPPFQALYAALTPQQQKTADGIFVRHIDKAVKKPG